MSFFFAKQSKKIGHSKNNFLSLQYKQKAALTKSISVSKKSVFIPPIISEYFDTKYRKGKRTFLSTCLSGSITIEASLVLPVFIFVIMSLIYFFNILYIQVVMQIQLENTAKLISSATCVLAAGHTNLNDDDNSLLEQVFIDSVGTIALDSLFITDELKEFTDNTLIVDGHKGLSFWGSSITNTDEPLNIILSYKIKMPFISEDIFTFRIKQNCYFKAFNGLDLEYNIDLTDSYVYVTEHGECFHESKYCSYFFRYTIHGTIDTITSEHPKIKCCTLCAANCDDHNNHSKYDSVYATSEYDVYHCLEDCVTIKFIMLQITYKEAKDTYSPCSRCVTTFIE